jgi:hypothetical protein
LKKQFSNKIYICQQACEKCSTSLKIRETQIKNKMSYHLSTVRAAVIKKHERVIEGENMAG